jgi:hypothetical protein
MKSVIEINDKIVGYEELKNIVVKDEMVIKTINRTLFRNNLVWSAMENIPSPNTLN